MSKHFLKIIILISLFFSGCAGKPPLSHEAQLNAALRTAKWLGNNYGFVENKDLYSLLIKVTGRLNDAVSNLYPGYSNYDWTVLVIESKEPNAFSLGEGIIVITKGLILEIDNEAELSAIIAHEMSHQLLGHCRDALTATANNKQNSPKYLFSLQQELDADAIAINLLVSARYNPQAMLSALTIGYRQKNRIVAEENQNWLIERTSALTERLKKLHVYYPTLTTNTREFNKIKKEL
jgi:predicted Zn-dependent protease